jgi:N-methylhydantoinase A
VLQTLNPTHLLGGRMPMRPDLAEGRDRPAGETSGLGPMETAQGII